MSEKGESESIIVGSIGVSQEDQKSGAQRKPLPTASLSPSSREDQQIASKKIKQRRSLPSGSNCLITVGAATAGKSVLQHALIHRLWKDDRITLDFWNIDAGLSQDQEKDSILMEWVKRFDDGELPPRTPKGNFDTFSIEFGEIKKKPVKISFVEISGEHFTDVLPKPDNTNHEPSLAPELIRLLTDRKTKKYFIFVADTARQLGNAENTDQDILFDRLLKEFKKLKLKRIRVLFVASKWDLMNNNNISPKQFFGKNFPNSKATLANYPGAKIQYIRFTIGQVETTDGDAGTAKILVRDLDPISRVVQWIYNNATGRRLRHYPPIRETLWEKIKRLAAG